MEKIGLREERKRDTYRLFIFIVILPTVFAVFFLFLGSVIPILIAGLLMAGGMMFLWLRVIPQLLGERGAQAGYYQEEASPYVRYAFVLLVAAVFYGIFQTFLPQNYAMALTIFALGVSYAILWYNAGREEREWLQEKQTKEKAYIESLGTNEGKCMSCMQAMAPEEQFCSNCGFKRRDTGRKSTSTDYIDR